VNDADTPDGIPDGYAVQSILDRAEAEARKMRITTSYNAETSKRLTESWLVWVDRIRESVRGEGK
jgi:hypothetical protein